VGRIDEALGLLRGHASQHALVAFSGGKDSCCCLDMAVRTFASVEAFHMWFVPGLDVIESQLERATKRWGTQIRQYPHPGLVAALKSGYFRPSHMSMDGIPSWSFRDVYDAAKHDAQCDIVITGKRKSDSMARRRSMACTAKAWPDELNPIAGWRRLDVLSYMAVRAIPIPPSINGESMGISLEPPTVLWLHDEHPSDYRKVCEVFPFVEAVVWRRDIYGIC